MPDYLSANYQVRDTQGNVYGPATGTMLRDWVTQGRIVAGMHIADVNDGQWVEVSQHPALSDLFGGSAAAAVAAQAQPYASPTAPGGYTQPADVSYSTPDTGPKQNIVALIGMISGIVAVAASLFSCVPICGCLGIPVAGLSGVAAAVMGAIGMVQTKKNPEMYTNRGHGMAGLIMGIAAILLLVLRIVLSVVFGIMSHR